MTSTPHHMAAMSSDEPRGYGAVGDARKRLEAQHQEHPDPAVRDLLGKARAEAWDAGYLDAAAYFRRGKPRSGPFFAHNPYRSAS